MAQIRFGAKWWQFLPAGGWMRGLRRHCVAPENTQQRGKCHQGSSFWISHATSPAGGEHKWSRAIAPSPGRKLRRIKVSLACLTSNQVIAACSPPPTAQPAPSSGIPNAAELGKIFLQRRHRDPICASILANQIFRKCSCSLQNKRTAMLLLTLRFWRSFHFAWDYSAKK